MARSNHHQCLLVVALAAVAVAACLAAGEASSSGIGFDLHHRSSAVVRRWAEERGHPLAAQWPADGSPEYYASLSHHDRALFARRSLAGADGLLAFADGNATYHFSSLGYLYYALVAVGTPNTTFLVALDTGSDLFWVPCDCKQCAPLPASLRQSGLNLRPYSPRLSSTSKPVTCSDALCDRPNACGLATNTSCPYFMPYASGNTSSSGVLVRDVLHLVREGAAGAGASTLQASIVFGCGQVQTGQFLEPGGAPDGLLGLGMEKVSVPSMLAAAGLVASDSFSMCFSPDGIGRINFGDAGSRGQAETPFFVSTIRPAYNVSFTSINVGQNSTPMEFAAIVDSGTSFTYLVEPEYTELATGFNTQVKERRTNFSSGSGASIPFEYCYGLSPGQTQLLLPAVSLTTKGGALFPVLRPFVLLADRQSRAIGYCLAIIKSDIGINLIGQNFMTGLKVVFDRQRSVLGWQEFDCYKDARAAGAPSGSPGAAPEPTPALGPRQGDGTLGSGRPYPGAAPSDGTSSPYPGAPPLPRAAAAGGLGRAATGLSLLLTLLAAALV